jgi:hypothetical protein
MKQEQNSFQENRTTDNGSLSPAAIATATSPLVALITMSKLKTVKSSKLHIFVLHIPIIWDVNGCSFEEANQPRQSNETEADYTERKARQKLNDFINCFDPCTDEKDSQQKESGQLTSLSQVNSPSKTMICLTRNPTSGVVIHELTSYSA